MKKIIFLISFLFSFFLFNQTVFAEGLPEEYNSNITQVQNSGAVYDQGTLPYCDYYSRVSMAEGFLLKQGMITKGQMPETYAGEEAKNFTMLDKYGILATEQGDWTFDHTTNNPVERAKKSIYQYGAVRIGYWFSTGFGYYDIFYHDRKWEAPNSTYVGSGFHSVTVLGWDDNFSRDNFAYYNYSSGKVEDYRPLHDGAFLCKNSWGSKWGDYNGYFWMSYDQVRSDFPLTWVQSRFIASFGKKAGNFDYEHLGGYYVSSERYSEENMTAEQIKYIALSVSDMDMNGKYIKKVLIDEDTNDLLPEKEVELETDIKNDDLLKNCHYTLTETEDGYLISDVPGDQQQVIIVKLKEPVIVCKEYQITTIESLYDWDTGYWTDRFIESSCDSHYTQNITLTKEWLTAKKEANRLAKEQKAKEDEEKRKQEEIARKEKNRNDLLDWISFYGSSIFAADGTGFYYYNEIPNLLKELPPKARGTFTFSDYKEYETHYFSYRFIETALEHYTKFFRLYDSREDLTADMMSALTVEETEVIARARTMKEVWQEYYDNVSFVFDPSYRPNQPTPTSVPKVTVKPTSKLPVASRSKVVTVAKVKKITIKKKGKSSLRVSWEKITDVKGYEVQYSKKKSFVIKTIKLTSKNNLLLKGLAKKKTYYIKVRAYKNSNGKRIYGKWSVVKKKKI